MPRKIIFLLAVPIAIISFFIHQIPDGKLHLYFLDVGQGDSSLIKTPNGTKILVDGGPSRKVLAQLGKTLSFWDRTFDYVILTHPDLDHYIGLIPILQSYRVKTFIMNGDVKKNPSFEALLQELQEQKISLKFADKNSDFSLPDGTTIDFLFPNTVRFRTIDQGANKRAIVFLLTSKSKKILFTSDIDNEIEEKLLSELPDIDILKVAHHGSRFATTKSFLEKTKPEIAVISVGKNRYGHPHPETLARLNEAGVKIYLTGALQSLFINPNAKEGAECQAGAQCAVAFSFE